MERKRDRSVTIQSRIQRRLLKPTIIGDSREGAPHPLLLTITEYKEFAPHYRRAWATARVSTRGEERGSRRVHELRLRIDMPIPGSVTVDDQTRSDAEECAAACIYVGSVAGNFTSRWDAWVSEPGYGTWAVGDSW